MIKKFLLINALFVSLFLFSSIELNATPSENEPTEQVEETVVVSEEENTNESSDSNTEESEEEGLEDLDELDIIEIEVEDNGGLSLCEKAELAWIIAKLKGQEHLEENKKLYLTLLATGGVALTSYLVYQYGIKK